MISLKFADLLFLIGIVVNAKPTNNQPFLVNRGDEITVGNEKPGSFEIHSSDDLFMFTTMRLPNDSKLMPTLGNGHLGFTVLSDAVYMNGLYNGRGGLSHRARIPNFVNILLADCLKKICNYTLNVKHGYFMVELVVENQFIVSHLVYAHRFFNRVLINQIHIQRLESKDEINLKLQRNPGNDEAPVKVEEIKRFRRSPSLRNDKDKSNNFQNNEPNNNSFQSTPPPFTSTISDDLKFTKNETIDFDGLRLYLFCGHIRESENGGKKQEENNERQNQWREEATEEEPSRQEEDVCVLWNHVPEEITLKQTASSISYKFVMAVDNAEADVRQEMMDVLRVSNDDLFASHISAWSCFWNDFEVEVVGNHELFRAIISSIFYLTSSLPSLESNLPQHPFYGLSPTGLGRGGSDLDDYEGHNFWDTEIFMLPPVALIHPRWARELLHYRFTMIDAARVNANASGYRGSRFPWESAATGIEVIQPGFEYIAEYQQHITGDIGFAVRQYLALTHDVDYMKTEGCELAVDIAKFWESRVTFNKSTGFYDIKNVMGPDEDHDDVDNNVFTNVIARYALEFGSLAKCLCGKNDSDDEWRKIAEKIKVLYDSKLDYHPQYENYQIGIDIKQADTVLIGYPLMFPMNLSTRLNDLEIYGNATRDSGPAMSSSMYSINYLDVDDVVKGNEMLEKSYRPFIRQPFNVWSEVVEGETGATNFMTGAGGFLQTIFNGFLGIRVDLKYLEIKNPKMPTGVDTIRITGLSYLSSKFELRLGDETFLRIYDLKDDLMVKIDDDEALKVIENQPYKVSGRKTTKIFTSKNSLEVCLL